MPRPITTPAFGLLATLLGALAGCNVQGPGLLVDAKADDSEPAAIGTDASEGAVDLPPSATSDCQIPQDADRLTDQILRMMNIERLDFGAVALDHDLCAVAAHYTCAMIDEGFFGHVHPKTDHDVTQRLDEAAYTYTVVGENLAAGYWNANEITDAWMASDTHRDIMLDPAFTRAGIAVRYGGEYGVYCVLVLAHPAE